MTIRNDGNVWCDCPKFHAAPVSLHTRRRHRKAAGILDTPDPAPIFPPHIQRQLDTDGGRHENDIRDTHVPEATTLDSPVVDDTFPNYDFDDMMMDIDGESDDGLLRGEDIDGCREIVSEAGHDAGDSEDSEDEEIEEPSYKNPIDSDEEIDFSYDEYESVSDEEMDAMDVGGFGSSDTDEVQDIMWLLQHLKELSGTNLDNFVC